MKGKLNCWEFKKCGYEPGGVNCGERVCPAAIEQQYDGINGGDNGGRACWIVNGTMCDGKYSSCFTEKYRRCALCSFYHLVRRQQGATFNIASPFFTNSR